MLFQIKTKIPRQTIKFHQCQPDAIRVRKIGVATCQFDWKKHITNKFHTKTAPLSGNKVQQWKCPLTSQVVSLRKTKHKLFWRTFCNYFCGIPFFIRMISEWLAWSGKPINIIYTVQLAWSWKFCFKFNIKWYLTNIKYHSFILISPWRHIALKVYLIGALFSTYSNY